MDIRPEFENFGTHLSKLFQKHNFNYYDHYFPIDINCILIDIHSLSLGCVFNHFHFEQFI